VLRVAAYPKDRAAYGQMLRSPFAGLSVAGLAICLGIPAAPFDDAPLDLLSESDRAKYCHGQRVYKKIIDKARGESICSLLHELWYGDGYRYETEWNPKTVSYRELYDYLFHLAAIADEKNQTLAAFTDYIHKLSKSGERLSDLEIPLERPGAVRLLTLHKSKGLEFSVVFLCCCDKTGRNDSGGDLYETEEAGITLKPPLPPACGDLKNIKRNYFWERISAIESGKRTAELRRLLYVGMTRAENELYLSGCLGVSKGLGINSDGNNDDDFSMLLKLYIDMKLAKGKNNIPGDSILSGTTFFGLCLPAFGARIPEEGLRQKPSFFTVEKIPLYSDQYIRDAEQRGSRFPNDQSGLNSFFEEAEGFYSGREIIETPVIPQNRFTPTSLPLPRKARLFYSTKPADGFSGDGAADVFIEVDKLLENYEDEKEDEQTGETKKFDARHFGTIAHICVEALLAEKDAIIPQRLSGVLSPEDADAFLEAGKELARRFVRSPLGIIAKASQQRKSEFPFRSLILTGGKEFFINGTSDLVFEDDSAIHVVDFKTDKRELPEDHTAQMASYYRAISELSPKQSDKQPRMWLYYLRSGRAVDVTLNAKDFDIEVLF
jgi:ATP-dependent helicase/nuclease subunit A